MERSTLPAAGASHRGRNSARPRSARWWPLALLASACTPAVSSISSFDQVLGAQFTDAGVVVHPADGPGIGLRLEASGRRGQLRTVAPVGPSQTGDRIEYRRAAVTEWWQERAGGLEQGFDLDPLPGAGPLELAIEVTGARAEVRRGSAVLRGPRGAVTVSALLAWDAVGHRLPAWMEPSARGLRLVVDDRGAVGRITVDPLLVPAAWTAESDQADAYFGNSVSSAGDTNGDGYDDVVIGAYGYDNGQAAEGRAYLFLGSETGLQADPVWTAESDLAGAIFGWSVAAAGDVDGDGYGDVIVGAYGYNSGIVGEGRASLFRGASYGLEPDPVWTVDGGQINAGFGWAVAGAGDVDGDGYGDVIVGAYKYDDPEVDEGRAYVFMGSATGLGTSPDWTAESQQAGALFGSSVSSAGDVDGDGFDDVLVGATGYDDPEINEGRAYMFRGSAVGLASSPAWTVEVDQDQAAFGNSLSSAGDVNGDGFDDVIVGASTADNGQSDEGRAWVYLGSAGGLATTAAWTTEGDQASAYYGTSVSDAGDVDGDGFADVIVGAPNYDDGEADEGIVRVYLGSSGGLGNNPAWTAEADASSSFFGTAVSSGGDVNGDGFADILVGATLFDDGEVDEGTVTAFFGTGLTLYADEDHDGFGDPDVSSPSGYAPDGYVEDDTDCDDGNPDAHPGGEEIGGNGIDEDCDGEDGPAPPDDTSAPPVDTSTPPPGGTGATSDNPGRWIPRGCDSSPSAPGLAAWLLGLSALRRRRP